MDIISCQSAFKVNTVIIHECSVPVTEVGRKIIRHNQKHTNCSVKVTLFGNKYPSTEGQENCLMHISIDWPDGFSCAETLVNQIKMLSYTEPQCLIRLP